MNMFARLALSSFATLMATSALSEPTERWNVLNQNGAKIGELTIEATDERLFGYTVHIATLSLDGSPTTRAFECIRQATSGSFVALWNCERDSGYGASIFSTYGATLLQLKESGVEVGRFAVRRSN